MGTQGGEQYNHADNPPPSSAGGIMHLIDFNEALVGRRLLGARRSTDGLESQMSFMNQPPDPSKRMSMKHHHVKFENEVLERSAFVKKKSENLQIKELLAMETVTAQRAPSVVARLMGLEMLSSESAANIQPKPTQTGSKLTRSMSDKQFQKQKQKQDIQCVPKELLDQPKKFIREPVNLSNYSLKEKAQSEFARKKSHGQKDKLNDSEACKHSQVMQLEQMKQQLALKQVLVQEKLTEAKRLLTGEQSSTSKWAVTHTKISEMEVGLDSKDFLRSSKSLSRPYVENKDIRVSKRSEDHFPVGSKMVTNKKHNPSFNFASTEDISDSAVQSPMIDVFARPIESRRHHDLNMFDAREAGAEPFSQELVTQKQSDFSRGMLESGYKGMDWDFIRDKYSGTASGKTHRPTRIVVLKPGPMAQSNEKMFMSSGPYSNAYQCEPMMDGSMSLERRLKGHRQDMQENPREIAREIARQVREKVVRELARKNKRSGSGITMNWNIESAETTAIPESTNYNASEIDLERFKAHSKGMASPNKPDESNVLLMSKKGERTLLKEKFRVTLPENDLTDDKIVISRQQKFFADGGSNGGCVFKSQDFEFSNAGELINAFSFDPLEDIGTFEKPDAGKVKAIQQASEALLQCTEESKLSLPPSLNSWLPVDGSLQGDANEHLEAEIESGHSFGNATIQDKGLIFEQLKESCNEMQTNLGGKDAFREEDTDSESSYFLPKFQSHSKIFGDSMFQPCTEESTKEESEDGDLTDQTGTSTYECSTMLEDFLIGSDGSEISEELSPVSVLVSSFEGSPNQAYVDDTFPIKELPVHLQLLKCDPNTAQMDDSKENGDSEGERLFWQVDSFPPRISSSVYLDDDVMSYFSCNDSPQIDDIWCPEGKVEDLFYIRCVLNASGFTGSKESYFTKWHSPHHAIDPSLFQRLENNCFTMLSGESIHASTNSRPKDKQDSPNLESSCPSIRVDSLHRHLLFDAVDDILLQKLKSHINYQPWFRPTKLVHMLLPSGKQLLKDIWAQLCTFDQQYDEKASLARLEANGDQWIAVQEEMQKTAFEVEQVVFSELMKEIVIDHTSPKSS